MRAMEIGRSTLTFLKAAQVYGGVKSLYHNSLITIGMGKPINLNFYGVIYLATFLKSCGLYPYSL
jgi:hypothetical protein